MKLKRLVCQTCGAQVALGCTLEGVDYCASHLNPSDYRPCPGGCKPGLDVMPYDCFIAKGPSVLMGAKTIARAISKTMAKRIANALNKHTPNREGV